MQPRGLSAAVLLLCGSVSAAPRAWAREAPEAQLSQAIALFNDFEDARAEAVLGELLKRGPAPDQAAKAHVYLGLIALNALKTDKARTEFRRALDSDPTTEIPFDASPKARLTFEQVRKEVELEAQRDQGPRVAPSGATQPPLTGHTDSATAGVAEGAVQPPLSRITPAQSVTAERGPDYTAAVVIGSLGAGALIAGCVVGAIAGNTFGQANTNPDIGMAQQLAQQAGAQGLAADILFGAGGAALATGVILFVVQAAGGSNGNSAVRGDANGFAFSF